MGKVGDGKNMAKSEVLGSLVDACFTAMAESSGGKGTHTRVGG